MTDDAVKIHQIFFDPAQRVGLDPAFLPYDNCSNPRPELREFYVFAQAVKSGLVDQADYTGLFSWKFYEKTGLLGEAVKSFIQKNQGYDVYIINPMIHDLRFRNVWVQGEQYHTGMIAMTEALLRELGFKVDLKQLRMGAKTMAYCNYWVATPQFWHAYFEFLQSCYRVISETYSDEQRQQMFQRADRKIDASYFPFIVERLFSTYLLQNPQWRVCSYRFSMAELWHRYRPTRWRQWLLRPLRVVIGAVLQRLKQDY